MIKEYSEPHTQNTTAGQKSLAARSTHTPGPWHLELSGNGAWSVDASPLNITTSLVIICNRAAWHHNAEESEANARLIVAAPNLLENLLKTTIFLESVVRNLSQMRDENSPQRTFLEGHIELNRAAIAKASEPLAVADSVPEGSKNSHASE